MNLALWFLQIILAVKLVTVSYSHGVRLDPAKMERGMRRYGAATRPLLILIAAGAFAGAIALLVPAATGIAAWLTPAAAAILAALLLAAIPFHIVCREDPKIPVSLILAALAALVAYGRWMVVPL